MGSIVRAKDAHYHLDRRRCNSLNREKTLSSSQGERQCGVLYSVFNDMEQLRQHFMVGLRYSRIGKGVCLMRGRLKVQVLLLFTKKRKSASV